MKPITSRPARDPDTQRRKATPRSRGKPADDARREDPCNGDPRTGDPVLPSANNNLNFRSMFLCLTSIRPLNRA